MRINPRRLAVVTAASRGTGLELAQLCAQNNFDLIIAADDPSVLDAAQQLAAHGVTVRPLHCDLSTPEGVDALRDAIVASGKPADLLVANVTASPGRDIDEVLSDAHACIDETVYLVDQIARSMRGRGSGRILINLQSLSGPNRILVDYFAAALGRQLKRSAVTVTCLMPGPPDRSWVPPPGFARAVLPSGVAALPG